MERITEQLASSTSWLIQQFFAAIPQHSTFAGKQPSTQAVNRWPLFSAPLDNSTDRPLNSTAGKPIAPGRLSANTITLMRKHASAAMPKGTAWPLANTTVLASRRNAGRSGTNGFFERSRRLTDDTLALTPYNLQWSTTPQWRAAAANRYYGSTCFGFIPTRPFIL